MSADVGAGPGDFGATVRANGITSGAVLAGPETIQGLHEPRDPRRPRRFWRGSRGERNRFRGRCWRDP